MCSVLDTAAIGDLTKGEKNKTCTRHQERIQPVSLGGIDFQ